MKLKVYDIPLAEFQEWCDKYEEKIIHVVAYKIMESGSDLGNRLLLAIDVS